MRVNKYKDIVLILENLNARLETSTPLDELSYDSWIEKSLNSNYKGSYKSILDKENQSKTSNDYKYFSGTFEEKIKLTKTDKELLALGATLQFARAIIIGLISPQPSGEKVISREKNNYDKEAHKKGLRITKKSKLNAGYSSVKNSKKVGDFRTADQIYIGCVPYDCEFPNSEGDLHRTNTLGHDPIMGWIFGVANILTDTITTSEGITYRTILRSNAESKFICQSEQTVSFFTLFKEAIIAIIQDPRRLCAALFKQREHLASDYKTPNGLPIPILQTILKKTKVSTDKGRKSFEELYKLGYDYLEFQSDFNKYLNNQTFSGIISTFTNIVIATLHWLLSDAIGDTKYYFARTLKILDYSNLLASSLNVPIAIYNPKMMDLSGLVNTAIMDLFTANYIGKLKSDFIANELLNDMKVIAKNINEDFK